MSTKSITGTGLLLAVALLAQSLRLIFPFIPNQVSMFLIGSITSVSYTHLDVYKRQVRSLSKPDTSFTPTISADLASDISLVSSLIK